MPKESTKRIQIDVPVSWVPKIDARKDAEARSRHNMILRLIHIGMTCRCHQMSEGNP